MFDDSDETKEERQERKETKAAHLFFEVKCSGILIS